MVTDTHYSSRDFARLMLMMRRMIREEFSVTVHLDEPEASDELLAFAERSDNAMLKEMAIELEPMVTDMTVQSGPVEAETPEKVTYYRGAPVTREKPKPTAAESRKPDAMPRIYRGQRVR